MVDSTLFTIGYGARSIEEFLETLRHFDIAYVIDVRSKPYSRYKPDFSKDQLERHLQAVGIRYVFMGDTLGGRPNDRALYTDDDKVDYAKLRESKIFKEGIDRLKKAQSQGLRVTLLCSEGRPEQCHRSHLIGQTLTDIGIPVTHIDENGDSFSQAEVTARTYGNQMLMPWLEDGLRITSRKPYDPTDDTTDADDS